MLVVNLFQGIDVFHFFNVGSEMIFNVVQNDHLVVILFNSNQSKRDSFSVESSSSSDSVDIVLIIRLEISFLVLPVRHIEVNHAVQLMNIDTSGQKVGSDQEVDRLVSEIFHGLVSFSIVHLSQQLADCIALISQILKNNIDINSRVDKNDNLGRVELLVNLFHHSQLRVESFGFTFMLFGHVIKLFNSFESQFFLGDLNFDRVVWNKILNEFNNFRRICRTEEQLLDSLALLIDFVIEIFGLVSARFIVEEEICLVNDNNLQIVEFDSFKLYKTSCFVQETNGDLTDYWLLVFRLNLRNVQLQVFVQSLELLVNLSDELSAMGENNGLQVRILRINSHQS